MLRESYNTLEPVKSRTRILYDGKGRLRSELYDAREVLPPTVLLETDDHFYEIFVADDGKTM